MTGLTKKQLGDAGEYLVLAELNLAGIPSFKVPDNWPGSDLIAHRPNHVPERISVKTRTHKNSRSDWVLYKMADEFEWLAVVLLPGPGLAMRRLFLIPRKIADERMRVDSQRAKTKEKYCAIPDVKKLFGQFENNFRLRASSQPDSE